MHLIKSLDKWDEIPNEIHCNQMEHIKRIVWINEVSFLCFFLFSVQFHMVSGWILSIAGNWYMYG